MEKRMQATHFDGTQTDGKLGEEKSSTAIIFVTDNQTQSRSVSQSTTGSRRMRAITLNFFTLFFATMQKIKSTPRVDGFEMMRFRALSTKKRRRALNLIPRKSKSISEPSRVAALGKLPLITKSRKTNCRTHFFPDVPSRVFIFHTFFYCCLSENISRNESRLKSCIEFPSIGRTKKSRIKQLTQASK